MSKKTEVKLTKIKRATFGSNANQLWATSAQRKANEPQMPADVTACIDSK